MDLVTSVVLASHRRTQSRDRATGPGRRLVREDDHTRQLRHGRTDGCYRSPYDLLSGSYLWRGFRHGETRRVTGASLPELFANDSVQVHST
nr:hypothetical protein [Tanacetum cinerariifolium]